MSDLLKAQEGCDEVIDNELCGIFYEDYKKKYLPFQVFLSKRGMLIRKELENDVIIDISDVVGSKYMGKDKNNGVNNSCGCSLTNRNVKNNLATTETDKIVYLTIHYYEQNREKRSLTLGFSAHSSYDENFSESEKWHEKIQRLKGRHFRTDAAYATLPMLILLNPKSGSGRASEHFYKQVMPVLVDADLPYQVQVTQQANSCKELISSTKDISKVWKGIIVVGGDGLLWEVLNGLFERCDSSEVLSVLSIGIIPCGSGNGLARTIAHLYQTPFQPKPVINAAISCVSGRTALMDVVRLEMKAKIMYSFLSVGWGFIADVDIESEILRSIGNWRFTLWSLYRTFTLKSYHGNLSYKKFNDNSVSQVNWTVEEGNFIMVHAAYQTHMGEDCFLVPKSKLDDGLIYLVIIREGITRLQLIRFLSAMETGTHIPTTENKFIAIIPVTAFQIEPSGNDGILTVDGERVEYGKIQGEVLPGTVKVMVPK